MTVKEAAEAFDMPEKRVRLAINRGWIEAVKSKGRYLFCGLEFKAKMGGFFEYTRRGRSFTKASVERFVRLPLPKIKFSTNAAADQFEAMVSKDNTQKIIQ